MNNTTQLEDKVSRSRGKHEGESSAEVCDRLSRTRVVSQRQLPTDLDYAVPTANISLINRRHYLPRLPLTLSSFEKNDQLTLTGHYISLPNCRQSDRDRSVVCFSMSGILLSQGIKSSEFV